MSPPSSTSTTLSASDLENEATIEIVANGIVVATVELGVGDTFELRADSEPIAAVLVGTTVLSWPTLVAMVKVTGEQLRTLPV